MKNILFVSVFLLISALTLMPKQFSLGSQVFYRPVLNIDLQGKRFYRDLEFKLGLDLKGGIHLAYEADVTNIPESEIPSAITATKTNIEQRVNGLGVSEALVQTSQSGSVWRILVELPGVSDPVVAIKTIGETAQLDFREVLEASPGAEPVFVPTGLNGKDLSSAAVDFQSSSGLSQVGPGVAITFTPDGAKKFSEITKKNIGKPLAIFLDDRPVSAPTVQDTISDGKAVISGNFTLEDAKKLVNQLNAGALPVSIHIVEQKNIGATLGNESVAKSVFAGVVGLCLIWLFMIANYGLRGFLANIALSFYIIISLIVFKLVPVTLTLAGIAGFILSVGMAVDANILIFERIKEELRWGRPKLAALELGFLRAWTSVRDSNVSSVITATILFWFGSGPIRGFATSLIIGILVSLFTSIVVTRSLLRLVYKSAK